MGTRAVGVMWKRTGKTEGAHILLLMEERNSCATRALFPWLREMLNNLYS
jgi:hypothetical protein